MAKNIKKFFIVLGVFIVFLNFGKTALAAETAATVENRCWSSSDCMKKTGNCQACFEAQTTICGEGRGFCYAKPVPTELEIKIPGFDQPIYDPAQYISKIYEWGVSVTGILAGIMIMIGGLLYITAGGSPERVSNAKSYISNALIGLVLALTSSFLLQTVNPALLSLRFPKIPLIAPATTFTVFCEELEAAGVTVDPEQPGKTSCGDLGIPKGTEENEEVPSKCTYQKCPNAEEACLPCESPDLLDCQKTANCFPCNVVRLDAALAAIVDPQPGTPADFQTPRRNYGSTTCDKFEPIVQYPYMNKCEFLDIPSFVEGGSPWDSFKSACGDFGTGAIWASLGSGIIKAGVSKFAGAGAEASEFVTKVSGAQAVASKIAGPAIAAGEVGESVVAPVGQALGSETLTDIGNTVSFAATCGGGVLVALSNPIALIAGGTYAAVKEWLKVGEISLHPEKFFGVKGTCALVKINCKEIHSCEDYGTKIKFKASGDPKSWQEVLVEMALEPEAFLSKAQNVRAYCDLNPCQLPTKCVSAMQAYYYWGIGPTGESPTFGPIDESPTSAQATGLSAANYKCLPLQMYALAISSDSKWIGSGTWLLDQTGVTRDMIRPIIELIPPGSRQNGQLCKTDADCATGLTCQGEPVINYPQVKELTPEQSNYIQITKDQEPHTVSFKRCQ